MAFILMPYDIIFGGTDPIYTVLNSNFRQR
jgi:hypothetical protein